MRRILAIAFCAMAVAVAAPQLEQTTFVAGETLDYDLSWVGISGGAMRMTISLAPGDREHFRITSVAKSSSGFARIFRVRDEIGSLVNRSNFSTVRYDKHLNERGKRKDDTTIIDAAHGVAIRRRPNKFDETLPVPQPVFDPLSFVYHLRVLDLEPGRTHRFTVVADGKVYTLEANVTGREHIDTPLGPFQTVVVEPRMQSGGIFKDEDSRMTIWYSDDERHLPVRIRSEVKVGTISATLKGVSAGVTSTEPGVK